MADTVNLSKTKADPTVTITCRHPQFYGYRFFLFKPAGQTWPDGNRDKEIHFGVFDGSGPATDTFPIGLTAEELNGYALQWEVLVRVPGGGSGQFDITVTVKQGTKASPDSPFNNSGTMKKPKLIVRKAGFSTT